MVVLQNRLDGRREGSALGIFTELQSANSVQLNSNGLTIWMETHCSRGWRWMLEWTNRYEKKLPRGETTALTIIHVHSNKYPILGQDRATRWTGIKTAILGGWQMRLVLRHSLFESTKRSTGGCGMAIDWEIYIEWYGSGRKDNKRARGGGWRKRN